MSTVNPNVPMAPVPVDPAKAAAQKDAQQAGQERKKEVSEEQAKLKSVMTEAAGKDHFEQQKIFGEAFEEREGEDSFRRQARIEREREFLMSAGDPTKDPVAKQAAMDMNTPLAGAKQDAQKIKDIGKEKLQEQSTAFKGAEVKGDEANKPK